MNAFALIVGAITAVFVSLIGFLVADFMGRKEKFERDIHRTSWAYSLAVLLFLIIMIFGGIFGGGFWTKLILSLVLAPVIFFLVYQFSASFLFKRQMAGRITFEVVIVCFLLFYLLKHPSMPKEVPLTETNNPNLLLIHIPNLSVRAEGRDLIEKCLPENKRDLIIDFKWAFASCGDKLANSKNLFNLNSNREDSLIVILKKYKYHSGLFSLQRVHSELTFESYDIIDDQAYSLKSKHSLYGFYTSVFPFLHLKELVSRIDGFPALNQRDPLQLNERILNMIKRKRDENPFFLFISYAPIGEVAGIETRGETALQMLITSLNKMGMLENTLIIFTSYSGEDYHKPLLIFYSKALKGETISNTAVSQADISRTIVQNATKVKLSDSFSMDLRDYINLEYSLIRPVYVWAMRYGSEAPAISVCVYPWNLIQKNDSTYWLSNLETDPRQKINLCKSEKVIFNKLSDIMQRPRMEVGEDFWERD